MAETGWRLRLGISPIAWSNDDMPELGGDTPLETCLAEARLAGYEGVELGRKFPRDPTALGPILERHGLALISGWYGARLLERSAEDEIAAMQPHIDLLRALGAEVVVFAEVSASVQSRREAPLSSRPVLDQEQWPAFIARLDAVARHLAEEGLGLVYHHHMGTVIEREAEVDRLMAETGPEVGLLLDTGHLAFAGADPAAVAHRHANRIRHVHCKDVRADVLARVKVQDTSFLDAVLAGAFTVPSDGAIDCAAVLRPLRAAGYAGWLVVEAEQDPAQAAPLTFARLGRAGLEHALSAVA